MYKAAWRAGCGLTSSEVGGKRWTQGLVTEPHTRKLAVVGRCLAVFFQRAREGGTTAGQKIGEVSYGQ